MGRFKAGLEDLLRARAQAFRDVDRPPHHDPTDGVLLCDIPSGPDRRLRALWSESEAKARFSVGYWRSTERGLLRERVLDIASYRLPSIADAIADAMSLARGQTLSGVPSRTAQRLLCDVPNGSEHCLRVYWSESRGSPPRLLIGLWKEEGDRRLFAIEIPAFRLTAIAEAVAEALDLGCALLAGAGLRIRRAGE